MLQKYDEIHQQMLKYETILEPYASFSKDAIRFKEEPDNARLPYARDCDRIIHTLAYTRYSDKTQVYSETHNDNISKRMTHVQFVSRASRTLARALGVNEDLCEAIALGHDVGHTPFGHPGERILNEISKKYLGHCFAHNLNSVRVFMNLEKDGNGCNLTLQVLDGIMCHNGEMVKNQYTPVAKTKEEFLNEYQECLKDDKKIKSLRAMTLEGCIVRLSDIIGYIGKDIDDAIRLHMIQLEDIPADIRKDLGCNNAEIMNNILMDVMDQSYGKPYIQLSDHMYDMLTQLKAFNTVNIYKKANDEQSIIRYIKMFHSLFEIYVQALEKKDQTNHIYQSFLYHMNENYLQNTSNEQKAIDYIAGMTDNFIEREYEKYIGK